ncbi:hypothetical protein pb186bvf_020308 [Paramecium bursaria]
MVLLHYFQQHFNNKNFINYLLLEEILSLKSRKKLKERLQQLNAKNESLLLSENIYVKNQISLIKKYDL